MNFTGDQAPPSYAQEFRCLLRGLNMSAMAPLPELLNHFFAKRREIIGFAGRDKAVVSNHLLIDPVCASVLKVE
jgi:hypothetical protein